MGPLGLTLLGAHVQAHVFGLEVVVVSLAATVGKAVTGVIFLVIPPTMKQSEAGPRIFRQTAYVCRETPEVRT